MRIAVALSVAVALRAFGAPAAAVVHGPVNVPDSSRSDGLTLKAK
jgi:hypothetical protein